MLNINHSVFITWCKETILKNYDMSSWFFSAISQYIAGIRLKTYDTKEWNTKCRTKNFLCFSCFSWILLEQILRLMSQELKRPNLTMVSTIALNCISFFSLYLGFMLRTYAKAGPPLPPCTK